MSDSVLRDVTKTKPSHFRAHQEAVARAKSDEPTTPAGRQLAAEVKESRLEPEAKLRLVREIVEYEGSHGKVTQTFSRKVRKQVRAAAG